MTFEIALVLIITLTAVVLFATERFSVDLVAIIVMAALLTLGIITPQESVSGFSNKATVTVAAMFVISAALFNTGAVNYLGKITSNLFRRNYWLGLITVMIAVGFFSAFINNTPVVAIFIPILLGVAKDLNTSTSKLLMPMSFASMFGGVCTLIGTSTNILVSSIAEEAGLPAFSMFEFAPLGLLMFGVGTVYMLLVGIRLIPDRRSDGGLIESFSLQEYITEIVLLDNSDSVGKPIKDAPLVKDIDITILGIQRESEMTAVPSPDFVLRPGDVLLVRCDIEKLKEIQVRQGVLFKAQYSPRDADIETEELKLVEVVIAPSTEFVGKTLRELAFRQQFGAIVLGIRQRGKLMREKLSETVLKAGDALLLEIKSSRYHLLRKNPVFVITSEIEQPRYVKRKLVPTLVIVAGVVAAASLGIAPIVASSVVGAVLLILIGSLTMEEAYKAIEWRIIFLLAGILTLGVALEKTGGADLISNLLLTNIGKWLGPIALISAFYLLTSLLTELMSNNATAVLLTPIAIATAHSLGVSPRPFLIAVTFAASASFMTPVGYQTNTLIYGPGQYRFADFLRVGTPLNLIFWLLASLTIPYFWPL